jgi:serine protease DegQ
MRRLWLLFAQTITIVLAIWFIVATLQPNWANGLIGRARTAHVTSTAVPMLEAAVAVPTQGSYREAAKRAMPSVVNIFTSKGSKQARNPLQDDPFFRKFFGDRQADPEEKQFSLGSGVIVSGR